MKVQNAKHIFFSLSRLSIYIYDCLNEVEIKIFTLYASPLTIRKIHILWYIYSTEITLTVDDITKNFYGKYLPVYRSWVWYLFTDVQHIHGPRDTQTKVILMAIAVWVVCVSGKKHRLWRYLGIPTVISGF